MDIQKIHEILPHRYPFLLVDRVIEVEPGERLRAYKNVTMNEEFFQGHFPGNPVMPGVLIVEAMAQAAALLAHATTAFDRKEKVTYLAGLDAVRFRQPVVPGDRLELEVKLIRAKGGIFKHQGEAYVDGKKVAECELLAVLADRKES